MSLNDEVFAIQDPNQPSNFCRRQRKQNRRELGCAAVSKRDNTSGAGPTRPKERPSRPSAPTEKASLLGSPNSTIEIHDGQFNATAGNHFSVTINAGGVNTGLNDDKKTKDPKQRVPKAREPMKDHTEHVSPSIIATQRSCDIYYRHLAPKGRGSPLWIPEPNKALNIEYQRTGMRIGDVGIINSRGSFDFLFNICLPADHPINPKTLPEDFAPLLVDVTDIQKYSEFKGESHLSSASVKRSHSEGGSSGLLFESSASEGAILTMPIGLNSEDLGNVSRFRKYAALHAENWYKYVNNVRGREARNGDVRLVTGYDKTSAWGMATFSNSTAENDALHLTFRPKEQSSLSRTYDWEYSGMAEVRAGPDNKDIKELQGDDPTQKDMTYENQCLFVRTLNITLQQAIWKKLESEWGNILIDEWPGDSSYSHSSSSQNTLASGRSSSASFPQYTSTHGGQSRSHSMPLDRPRNHAADSDSVSFSSRALTGHPSELLNEMLLKLNPTARIAITEDKDWISVMTKEDIVLPSNNELYSRILSSFNFCEEEGYFFLEKRENEPVIVHDHEAQHSFYPSRKPSFVPIGMQKSKEEQRLTLPRLANTYPLCLPRPSATVDNKFGSFEPYAITKFRPAMAHPGTKAISQDSVPSAWGKRKNNSMGPSRDENVVRRQSYTSITADPPTPQLSLPTPSNAESFCGRGVQFEAEPFLKYPPYVDSDQGMSNSLPDLNMHRRRCADLSGSLANCVSWLDKATSAYNSMHSTSDVYRTHRTADTQNENWSLYQEKDLLDV